MKTVRSVFLVPFFGDLPDYFPFWAKSCEPNGDRFHWYVYSDRIDSGIHVNDAVDIVPYRYDEMARDFRRILGIGIPRDSIRKTCDFRLLFYHLRKDREPLDRFDFVGYTDMDLVYGDLARFLPPDMEKYAMVSADDVQPCGPFTLMKRSRIQGLADWGRMREVLEMERHVTLNEDPALMEFVAGDEPVFCRADPLQPQRSAGFDHRRNFSVWDDGKLTVWDARGNRKEGGFHHFSRYKGKRRFAVSEEAVSNGRWGVCKRGVIPVRSPWTLAKMMLTLFC